MTAGYDQAAVIRDVSLAVDAGEVVALLGANGAGKTTTLRAVSGIVKPIAGRVMLDGDDLARQSPTARARLGIAHVPEGRGVFFGLTVAEHLRLGHRGEQLDADARVPQLPEAGGAPHRRAGLLSGGEQQMLAVGRALARHPRLLLLDELSLGLAPVIVENLLPIVRDSHGSRAAPFSSSSSTFISRWRSQIVATCSRTARSSCTTAPRSSGTIDSCSSPATWENKWRPGRRANEVKQR